MSEVIQITVQEVVAPGQVSIIVDPDSGAPLDQDNINVEVAFTVLSTDDLSQMAGTISALPQFVIGERQIAKFIGRTVPGATTPRYVVLEFKNKGKGVYGAGTAALSYSDFIIVSDGASESPVINQDNIAIRKIVFLGLDYTQAQVAAVIQTLPGFTITEIQSLWIVSYANVPDDSAFGFHLEQGKTWKVLNKGKGAYGVGYTIEVKPVDLLLTGITTATAEDIENEANTQTINYGALTSPATVSSWLNAKTPAITIQEQTTGIRLFKGTINGLAKYYIFTADGGVYGAGQLQTTIADFELYNDNGASAGIPDMNAVNNAGNTIQGETGWTDSDGNTTVVEPEGFTVKNNEHSTVIRFDDLLDDGGVITFPAPATDDVVAYQAWVNGLTLASNPASSEIYLKNAEGDTLATLNVGFLNNEGTTFYYNSSTGNLELKNDAGDVLSTIPVSAFVTNIVHSAAFNGATPSNLEFKDTTGAVLFTVPFAINNISGLQTALNAKLTGASAGDSEVQQATTPTTPGNFFDTIKFFNWKTSANFRDLVRAVTLTGISFASAVAITATDSVLIALGKLQAQINGFTNDRNFAIEFQQLSPNAYPSYDIRVALSTPVLVRNVTAIAEYQLLLPGSSGTTRTTITDINTDIAALTTGQAAAGYSVRVKATITAGESFGTAIIKATVL